MRKMMVAGMIVRRAVGMIVRRAAAVMILAVSLIREVRKNLKGE